VARHGLDPFALAGIKKANRIGDVIIYPEFAFGDLGDRKGDFDLIHHE
jgi:hypothetical protein